jgi:hypothetical protein
MQPVLVPAQVAALQALHKDLDALLAAEGKGGPTTAATVTAIKAELMSLYQELLGLKPAK